MKQFMHRLRSEKLISLAAALLTTFTFLTAFRYYINDNVYKAFTLGNLGQFGSGLYVSVIVPVLLAVGFLVGFLLWFLTKRKLKPRASVTLYAISGLFAIVILLIQPYNLQLLLPAVNQQTVVMVNFIALAVFGAIELALLTWGILFHIAELRKVMSAKILVSIGCLCAFAVVISLITAALKWPFAVCVAVYASVLCGVNALHSLIYEKESLSAEYKPYRWSMLAPAIFAFLIAVLLICGYYIIEPMIALAQ